MGDSSHELGRPGGDTLRDEVPNGALIAQLVEGAYVFVVRYGVLAQRVDVSAMTWGDDGNALVPRLIAHTVRNFDVTNRQSRLVHGMSDLAGLELTRVGRRLRLTVLPQWLARGMEGGRD